MWGNPLISFADAERILWQEARRAARNSPRRFDVDTEDRQHDGWIILLESDPATPELARTIVRRRLRNRERDSQARKRGGGFAIGRLDAGWEEAVGYCPENQIVDAIDTQRVARQLNFSVLGTSRQALHQAISRAKKRWLRIRRPFDV